ncbi:hypothetical protein GCM10011369_07550 [Neiella marina]|uniref:Fumarylacetoacetase-like C-terminal domain-containing protein n=1 Tax=Neiella marina TaxID=508461 RepID=A0A8J2XNG8_9GAMM|nr:fumarylacetoacetate hydrolase family protein [Neiella marina]GGA68394.1 hypothetical protein GCM10011369_07550 [Neiella marina]
MQFVSFMKPGQSSPNLGILDRDLVLDVAAAAAKTGTAVPTTFNDLYSEGLAALPKLQQLATDVEAETALWMPLSEVSYGALSDAPEKVICIGLNYKKHAEEANMAIPTNPVVFSKFANSLCGHGVDVDVTGLEQLDYEAELALVIGKEGKHIAADDALDHVFGYCNANDLSERALQFDSGQWLHGKTLDDFLPMGPWLVTADEFGNPNDKTIVGRLNGEVRQQSNTADMIFDVKTIIAYVSKYMTLKPGDVIITGTPEGVILGFHNQQWLKAGDTYEVEIEGLGVLRNTLTA